MAQLTGPATGFPGDTGKTYTTPYPIRPGTRARGAGADTGNEYEFVDFGGPVSPGIAVVIDDFFVATPLLSTSVGRVGIACGGPGPHGTEATSDLGGWVQIFGLCTFAQTQSASDADTKGLATVVAQLAVTSPSGSLSFLTSTSTDANRIYGMWGASGTPLQHGISGASDSSYPVTYTTLVTDNAGVGLGHTGLTVAVMLNYPYVVGSVTNMMYGNPTSI